MVYFKLNPQRVSYFSCMRAELHTGNFFFSIFAASLLLTDAVKVVSRGTTQEDGDLGNLVVGVCRGERRREKLREIPVGEA